MGGFNCHILLRLLHSPADTITLQAAVMVSLLVAEKQLHYICSGSVAQPASLMSQPASVVEQPASLMSQPASVVEQPAGVVDQSAKHMHHLHVSLSSTSTITHRKAIENHRKQSICL